MVVLSGVHSKTSAAAIEFDDCGSDDDSRAQVSEYQMVAGGCYWTQFLIDRTRVITSTDNTEWSLFQTIWLPITGSTAPGINHMNSTPQAIKGKK